jgi:hypothetical protein
VNSTDAGAFIDNVPGVIVAVPVDAKAAPGMSRADAAAKAMPPSTVLFTRDNTWSLLKFVDAIPDKAWAMVARPTDS